MKCFNCNEGRLVKRNAEIPGKVRNESFVVNAEAQVCNKCGFQVLSQEQSDSYGVLIADTYRAKHGLLTSKALKALRGRLKMTQDQFAAYVGVGIASVKRWESGLIQDEAMDQLIRLKTDVEAARSNVQEVECRLRRVPGSHIHREVIVIPHRTRSTSKWLGTFSAEFNLPESMLHNMCPGA